MNTRPLTFADYDKKYIQLLGQLTTVGEVTREQFDKQLAAMLFSDDHHVIVVEDPEKGVIVGTASLLIEHKFIHSCGMVGHIEDVVVDASCRGMGLGRILVDTLIEMAMQRGCYKVVLDCTEKNVPFYETCGLSRKEMQMVKYL